MSKNTLTLSIDPKDLPIIRGAQQRITLAKPVGSDSSPNVVWLSIDPFQRTDVEWEEQYGIYASTTKIQEGALISKLSETDFPAQDGASYTYTPGAVFAGPSGSESKGTYAVQNDMPYNSYPALTFGLTQSALINQGPAQRKPISASSVLATQFSAMTPFTTVFVWLQSQFASETIITKIVGRSTKVKFGGGIDNIALKYDPQLGLFIAAGVQGKTTQEHPAIEMRTPLVV